MITQYESSRVVSPSIYGLNIAWASTSSLTVSAGRCTDVNRAYDIEIPSTLTLDMSHVGANGIDTGTIGATKIYYIFAIGSSLGKAVPAVIASLSSTPLMPYGYDIYRRIGWALTYSNTHFHKVYQIGNGSYRKYIYDGPVSVLSAGTSATYAAVSLAAGVPGMITEVILSASFTPAVAGDAAILRPAGSSSTTACVISGSVAAVAQKLQVTVPSSVVTGAATIEYAVAASGSLSLSVAGYVDVL
jgi:hypothetical protein